MPVELISVHLPKAAGTAFRSSLQRAYGDSAVYVDYEDDPVNPCSQWSLDPDGCRRKARAMSLGSEVRVIHGHFHADKYAHFQDARRITFLRHPVANIISIYYFWKTLDKTHSLFDYFRDRKLTLLEMARLPALRYLFSRTFFANLDLDTFDFIGTVENYQEDVQRLARLLGRPLTEVREHITQSREYPSGVEAILNDPAMVEELHDTLAEDIQFYDYALRSKAARAGLDSAPQNLPLPNGAVHEETPRAKETELAVRDGRLSYLRLEAKLSQQVRLLAEMDRQLAEMKGKAAQDREQLRIVLASWSWRVTNPLRWVVNALTRPRRK